MQCASGKHLGLRQQFFPLSHKCLQFLLSSSEQVYLVDDQQHGDFLFCHLVEEVLGLGRCLNHVGDVEQHVGIDEGSTREVEHRLLKLELGFKHTGSVAEHNLVVLAIDDSHDAVTGGLRLAGDNRQFLTHQQIAEGGLAHVGVSYNIYKACAMHDN